MDSIFIEKSRGHCTKDYYKDSIVSKFFKEIFINESTLNLAESKEFKLWKKTINKHNENPCAGGEFKLVFEHSN